MDRKKYDMQQALAMNGKAPLRNSTRTVTKPAVSFANQVNKAFQDLDHAEDFADKGKLEEASSLYQHTIAILIKLMNDLKKHNGEGESESANASDGSVSREVIMERTRLALTEAEAIKEKLKTMQEREKKEYGKFQGLALFRKSKSEKMKLVSAKEHQIPELQSSKSADGPIQKPKPARIQRSNLDYKTNDAFIETIKKDMYVDSKSLTTTWDDISGLKKSKQALQEAAILPLLRPDLYTGLRSAPKGILLYGPPGTGKTMLVKAVAHESQCILFSCSASSMTSKWVGDGEKLVRTLFRMATDVAPSIIFLDEMDALLGRRKSDGNSEQESSRRFKTEFMVQMDGIAAGGGGDCDSDSPGKKLLLIGCTNCPWDIDDAVMRRFQRRIYVPLPDRASLRTLWNNLLSKSKDGVSVAPKDVVRLVTMSEGFSCSDISSIANEAAFGPLRDLGGIEAIRGVNVKDVRPIQMKDFESAIQSAKKSVSNDSLMRYKEWETAQAASS